MQSCRSIVLSRLPRASRGVVSVSKAVVSSSNVQQHWPQSGWFGDSSRCKCASGSAPRALGVNPWLVTRGSAGCVRSLSVGGDKGNVDEPERSSETGSSGKAEEEELPVWQQVASQRLLHSHCVTDIGGFASRRWNSRRSSTLNPVSNCLLGCLATCVFTGPPMSRCDV
eukprot:153129-Rhodomonas_salina.2